MNTKEALRQILPYGWIEARRERFRLSRLGLPRSRELVEAVNSARYDLWPISLRRAETPWTLVDVGANVGDFTRAVATLTNLKSAIAFEPQPACCLLLGPILAQIPNATLIQAAVGRAEGEMNLHLTGNDRMASGLLPRDEIHLSYNNDDFRIKESITVPQVTLDQTIADDVTVGLLKLDVQGFELEVLAGATNTLNRTEAILIEVNFIQHYHGGATFDDIYTQLRETGFRISGISAPYLNSDGEALWADALFVKE